MKSILISIPNQHWIHSSVVYSALLLLNDKRYKTRLIMPSHKPYEDNLSRIVKDFISGSFDFWLNIDSDNPPTKNPLDLVGLNKDIIGLPTPIWHFTGNGNNERPVYWNAYDYLSEKDVYIEHQPRIGLQKSRCRRNGLHFNRTPSI